MAPRVGIQIHISLETMDLLRDVAYARLIAQKGDLTVPELIEAISRYCVLRAGDLIFTGTPAGVGRVRNPRRYLVAGEIIRSEMEGVGSLLNRCVGLG